MRLRESVSEAPTRDRVWASQAEVPSFFDARMNRLSWASEDAATSPPATVAKALAMIGTEASGKAATDGPSGIGEARNRMWGTAAAWSRACKVPPRRLGSWGFVIVVVVVVGIVGPRRDAAAAATATLLATKAALAMSKSMSS
jgi:hypothetical protein